MLRERPLTWLFILATVVVDLALSVGRQRPVFSGILMGQVAAIAIWAVVGQSHRLTRGSLLVVAVGVLAILPEHLSVYSSTLTLMAAYALVWVATTLVVVWLRNQVRNRFEGNREKAPLRVPLIEFFGWTIVVAIASFGARYMNFDVWRAVPQDSTFYTLVYAIPPIALILFDSRFRSLHLVKAVLFIGGVFLTVSVLLSEIHFGVIVTISAVYLTAWLLVRSIEYDQLKTAAENDDSTELDADE
jgi:hypothetical protein